MAREAQNEETKLRLEINRLRLDEEWQGQAQQFYTWSAKYAEAQQKLDAAKLDLTVHEGELNKEIRKNYKDFGLEKATDDTVKAAISSHTDTIRYSNKVNEARYALNMADAAVQALEHRKRALTQLVELWIREYYSEPHAKPMSEGGKDFKEKMGLERIYNRSREREAEKE